MKLSLTQSISTILSGQVLATPTDTVYGLVCGYSHLAAMREIYRLKGRSLSSPLILLLSHMDQIDLFIEKVPSQAYTLMQSYWPGPLTIVLTARQGILPSFLCSEEHTVGIRIPNHPALLSLIDATGPLASTSANRSGEPTAAHAAEIESLFGNSFPLLETSPPPMGQESTIISFFFDPPRILRRGIIDPIPIIEKPSRINA